MEVSIEEAVLCQNANDLLNWQSSEFLSSRLEMGKWGDPRGVLASYFENNLNDFSSRPCIEGPYL